MRKISYNFKLLYFILYFYNITSCIPSRNAVDLISYINQDILDIAQLETRALKDYSSVTGTNFVNNDKVYIILKKDVIPIYKRFLELLKKIFPENEEIRKLHIIYISGAEELYKGFIAKMNAIERNDGTLIIAANEQIERGRIETEKWRMQLILLYKTYGVRIKISDNNNHAK